MNAPLAGPLEETLSQFNRWLAIRYRAEAERRGYPIAGRARAAAE